MLDTKVGMLSDKEIVIGLERLLKIERCIELDRDHPPHIEEAHMDYFKLVFSYYKALPHSHQIHKKYKRFKVQQAYTLVQSYFTRQQIDKASFALIDMHAVFESILDNNQPAIEQEALDNFRNALDLFRMFVRTRKLDRRYAVVLPRLEQEYAFIEKYVKLTEAVSIAVPS